jgi:hypothetical protein
MVILTLDISIPMQLMNDLFWSISYDLFWHGSSHINSAIKTNVFDLFQTQLSNLICEGLKLLLLSLHMIQTYEHNFNN